MESQQPSACKEAVQEGVSCYPGSISFSSLPRIGKINVEPSKSAPPAVGSVLLGMHCLGQGRCRRGLPGGTSVLRVQGGGGTLQALRYQPWGSGSTLPCSATPQCCTSQGLWCGNPQAVDRQAFILFCKY